MTLAELRQIAELLSEGATLTLDRAAVQELVASAAPAGGTSGDLTAEQAAAALGCSPSSVRRLCERGRLRGYKLGTGRKASWRIPPNALADFRAADPDAADSTPRRAAPLGVWRNVARKAGGSA